METQESNVTESVEAATAANVKKDAKQRSASNPSISVLKAYAFAERINEKFSTANDFTREEYAHIIGVHHNSISRDIASCVQYGFLAKKDGKYQLTQLFTDIFRPESERDKKANLLIAFANPKLYQELIQKFDGHVIPEELPNTLIKHHGITESASKDAADTFITSATEVGVYDNRKMLKYTIVKNLTAKTQYAEIIEETPDQGEEGADEGNQSLLLIDKGRTNDKADIKVPIHLTNNKAACLVYPNNISAKDIKLLEHAINGILLRLELEKDEDEGI